VYAYLGASVFGISGNWLAVAFALLVLMILPFVRGIMVFILPAFYQCAKKTFPLNNKELKVCWYSGLVRGVIAFALALQIESSNEDFISTIVLVIVMITTLVGSSFLKTFCECIGLQSEVGEANLHDSRVSNLSKSLIE
jgi:NhaP-type Na+/H+ or K+/H+ antiporter